MANKSVRDRIKITKNKKMKRQSQGLGHNRSRWNSNQKGRKLREKKAEINFNKVKKLLNE